MCCQEAVVRGKVRFDGLCVKHGKVQRIIHHRGHYAPWSSCTECEREKMDKYYRKTALDLDDLARRRRNNEAKLLALKKGNYRPMLECKHHGRTKHHITNRGSIGCMKCSNERQKARYHRVKNEQSAKN